VVAGTCLTHDGEVRHAPTADALAIPANRASDNEGVA
jgi:NAD(P) transhydrogenase subunit alpha